MQRQVLLVNSVSADNSVVWCRVDKQLMMRGNESRRLSSSGDVRKPLSVQTDNTDSVDSASDADSEYVTCVPSPHTFSLSSLRRDNLSARGFAVLGGSDARGCAKKVVLMCHSWLASDRSCVDLQHCAATC